MPRGDMSTAEYHALLRDSGGSGSVRPPAMRQPAYTPVEQAFIALLKQRTQQGELLGWAYRPFVLRLDSVVYTPRFAVLELDGLVFVELREKVGPLEENPEIQCRVAAQRWPAYDWLVMAKRGKGFVGVWASEGEEGHA